MSLSESESDYATTAIPLAERKSAFTMGLLWITMVTSFPTVMFGVEWYKKGLTLTQVASLTGLSCMLLMLYSIPSTQLGARSGLSYTALSRCIFGRFGSRLITCNLIWLFVGCYGLIALYLAESLNALFHWQIALPLLSAIVAMLMSVNNFFAFTGVANFARYVAAPALIGWVGYTFCKAAAVCPPTVWQQPETMPFAVALTSVSTLVIGFAVWGNESDYWRHSKPGLANSALPLMFALAIGQMIFPLAGWMVAKNTGITEYGAATAFINDYSFAGMPLVAALVLSASYFACNDSNLFGAVQACENLKPMTHRRWAFIVALVSALCAAVLSTKGLSKSMELFTSLNPIVLPTPTVSMLCEWFLRARVFKAAPISELKVLPYDQLPFICGAAFVALLAGTAVGLLTSGLLPGLSWCLFGVSSIQAWLTAAVVYIPLRLIEHRRLGV